MTLRFGTDGVRGVANRELTCELVTALGRAAVRVLGHDQPFVVGRDTRRSGPMLEAALVAGICAEGADVVLVGVLPTPGVAALARERGAPGAVISASHNPFADNGVKLLAAGGRKIPESVEMQVEQELRELATTQPEPGPDGVGVGVSSEHRNALDDYVASLVDALQGRHLTGLHVVLDCGNGAAFRAAPTALRSLGATVDVLNASPDGVNINANCGSTHPGDLQEAVLASRANAGLAFDGDADRVIAVDERGRARRRRPDPRDRRPRPARPQAAPRRRRRRHGDVEPGAATRARALRHPPPRDPGRRPQRARRAGAAQPRPRRRAVGARDLRRPRHHRRWRAHRHLPARHDGPTRPRRSRSWHR